MPITIFQHRAGEQEAGSLPSACGPRPGHRTAAGLLLLAACLACGTGCRIRQNMYDQPKYEPYEKSGFFGDNHSAREHVTGVVPVGFLQEDDALYRGRVDDAFAGEIPIEVTADVLARGAGGYAIYCAPCHGDSGYGNGMIVQRGYKRPPSYHTDDLRNNPSKPVGYLFDVISNGFGVMPGYSYQVKPHDRWAIVAYLRALQLSQNANVAELPEEDREALAAVAGE